MPDTGSAPSQKYWKVLYSVKVRSESSDILVDEGKLLFFGGFVWHAMRPLKRQTTKNILI
jgi:hypothetical protein